MLCRNLGFATGYDRIAVPDCSLLTLLLCFNPEKYPVCSYLESWVKVLVKTLSILTRVCLRRNSNMVAAGWCLASLGHADGGWQFSSAFGLELHSVRWGTPSTEVFKFIHSFFFPILTRSIRNLHQAGRSRTFPPSFNACWQAISLLYYRGDLQR